MTMEEFERKGWHAFGVFEQSLVFTVASTIKQCKQRTFTAKLIGNTRPTNVPYDANTCSQRLLSRRDRSATIAYVDAST